MEKAKYFLCWKSEIKKNKIYNMHDFKYVDNMKNMNNHHLRAHFNNINISSLVFTLWKRGETSSTTSLPLIRTSSN